MIYLAIQTTYQQLQIGLFQGTTFLDSLMHDSKESSTHIISSIDTLLTQNKITMHDLSFIAVNQGPAPFTSLRVVIATVNGLSFATKLPLVGVDGLEAFVEEYSDSEWPYTVALINAYNNDVYYAVQKPDQSLQKGCKNIDVLLNELKKDFVQKTIRFIGNGATLFKDEVITTLGKYAYIPQPTPSYPSLHQIALTALKQWHHKHNIVTQILPLYLKTLRYRKSICA